MRERGKRELLTEGSKSRIYRSSMYNSCNNPEHLK